MKLPEYTDEELVAMPRPNVKLLDEVLDYIIANPEEWDQAMWAKTSSHSPCGTTMCFAGHACSLAGEAVTVDEYGELLRNGDTDGWYDAGREYLGLTNEEAQRMFYNTITVEDPEENLSIPEYRAGQLLNIKVEVERIRARAKAQDAAFNRLAQEFIDAAGLDDVVKPGYQCPESADVLQGTKGGASE